MSPIGNGQTPPIDYPRVTIGGVTYVLKFSAGALYRLEKYGLDPANIRHLIETELNEGRRVMLICRLLSACLGTPLEGGRWKPIGVDPEELADLIHDPKELAAIDAQLTQSLKKAAPAPGTTTAQGTTPTTQTQ